LALPEKRIKRIKLPGDSGGNRTYEIVPGSLVYHNTTTNLDYAIQPPAVSADSTLVVTSDLATVATSGSYNDLIDKPTTIESADNADKVDQLHMLDQSFAYNNALTIEIGAVQAIVNTGLTESEIFALAPTGSIYGKLYYASDTQRYWRRHVTTAGASSSYWRNDTAKVPDSLALANQQTSESFIFIRLDTKTAYYSKLAKFFVTAGYDNINGSTNIMGFCRQQNQFEITSCNYNGNNLLGVYQESANTNKYIFKFRKYGGTYGAENTYRAIITIYTNFGAASSTIEFIDKNHADYNTVANYSYRDVPAYGIVGNSIYGTLLPISNNAYDLGNSSYKWRDLHLNRNLYLYSNQIKNSSYTWTFPAKTGTVALTSDLTNLDTNQKITANGTTFGTNDTINLIPGTNVAFNTVTTGTGAPSITISATDTTYESKAAVSGGTDVSLVTTGEKYIWNTKQDALTFDNTPTQSSTNPVTSGGIYSAIDEVREIAEGRKQTYVVSDVTCPEFNSQTDQITVTGTFFTDVAGITHNWNTIKPGDTFYVVETDIPDRWVSNLQLHSQVSTLAGTTWLMNNEISTIIGNWTAANLNFTSNGNSYTSIVGYTESGKIVLQYRNGSTPTEVYRAPAGWVNDAYKNISIINGTDVETANVISWFNTNATIDSNIYEVTLPKLETVRVPVTSVSVNNSTITPVNGNVNITVPTTTNELTNNSGFITLSDVPQEIYWCTYGTTTYTQITQALRDGKLPVCFYDNKEYVYVGLSTTNRYTFASQLFDTCRYISVNDSNSWGNGTNNFEVTSNKVTSISSSSTNTQYPSALSVYSFVNNSLPTIGILNTNNTATQTPTASESFSNTINLHKVSKTGSYIDLLDKPTIPDNTDFVDLSTNQTINGVKSFTQRPTLFTTRLPDVYQEVTYLHADGNQYIDTGMHGYMGWTYKLIFQQDNAVSYRCWGVFNQSSYNGGLNMSLTYTFPDWMLRWETTSGQTRNVLLAPIDTEVHTLIVDNGDTYFDNIYKGKSLAHDSSVESNYNAYLFTINPGGTTPTTSLVGKIFYYEVYDNTGTLRQQFIPCIRKADNKPGFYDLVSDTFKINASGSSDDFTIGSIVTDSTFLVAADLASVATSGSYTDLTNKPTHTLDQSASNKVRLTVTGEAAQEITINNVANASQATYALDSDKLDGHSSDYFAVDADTVKLANTQTVTGQKNFGLDPTIDWEIDITGQAVDISDFKAIEYLIFNGTDYIDTGLTFTTNAKVGLDLTMQNIGTGAQGLFGRFDSGTSAYIVKNTAAANIQITVEADSFTGSPGFTSGQRYLIEWKNKNIYVDNISAIAATTISNFEASPAYIGNRYTTGGSVTNGLNGRLYGATWTEENGNNHIYKPCYQVSTNQVGLFDINFGKFYPVYNYSDQTTPKTYTLNTTGGPEIATPITFNSTIASYVTNAVNTVASKVRIPSWAETTAVDNISSGPINIGGTVSSDSNNNTYINFGTAANPKAKNAFITTYNNGFIMGANGQTLYFMMADALRPTSNANGAALKLGNTTRAWNALYIGANGQTSNDAGAIVFNNSYAGMLKSATLTAARNWTLPNNTGTIALTTDIPSITLTTTAGSEALTVGSDTLNLVTRDTAQTVSGIKTFSATPILSNNIFLKAMHPTNGNSYALIGMTNGANVEVGFNTEKIILNGSSLYPAYNIDLGNTTQQWKNIYLTDTSKLINKPKNTSVGLVLPDTTSWTADKTIATLDDIPAIPSAEIFWATYGTTTGAEIAAAITAGQYIAVKYSGNIYGECMLHPSEGTNNHGRYYFSGFYGSYTRLYVYCDVEIPEGSSAPVWSHGTRAFGDMTTTGAQTVSGKKTFSIAPILNNSIFLTGKATTNDERNLIGVNGSNQVVVGNTTNDVVIETQANLLPSANATKNLGSSSVKWQNLYLSGNLSDGTNNVLISNIVTTNTDQTITGTKTFGTSATSADLKVAYGALVLDGTAGSISSTTSCIKFVNGSTEYHSIKANTSGILFSAAGNNYGFYSYGFTPTASNSLDLGRSNVGTGRWNNIHMAGTIKKYNGDTAYTLTLQNKTGTVALLSDIPSAPVTDVQINNTSILSNTVANFNTKTAYNASTNKIATESDISNATITIHQDGIATDQTFTLNGSNTTINLNDTNTTYALSTGDSDGQIKVTPSVGDAYNVAVKGLGSAAYTDKAAYWVSNFSASATNIASTSENPADLNTYTTPGSYKVAGAAIAATILNGPQKATGYAFQVVQGGGGQAIYQIAYVNAQEPTNPNSGGRVFLRMRHGNSGKWFPWTEYVFRSGTIADKRLVRWKNKLDDSLTTDPTNIIGALVDAGINYDEVVNTTSTLTADKIVLGNGTKKVKISSTSLSDLALKSELPDITNMVSTTDTLTNDYLILGNGNKAVKKSSIAISEIALKTDIPEAMVFIGTVGDAADSPTTTWANLPTAGSTNKGNTYKVITAHATTPICKVGDTIISNGTEWVVIPSGDEPGGTVTNIGAEKGLITDQTSGAAITSSGKIKANLVNETLAANASSYVTGAATKFYAVQLDSNGKLAVNVPWTDNNDNTWRPIQVGGTELLGSATSTGYVNYKAATDSGLSVTGSGHDITIGPASGYTIPTATKVNEWDEKQDALSTQTAYTSKGTATKVPQITTNTLGQVTGITEVDINFPTFTDHNQTVGAKNSSNTDITFGADATVKFIKGTSSHLTVVGDSSANTITIDFDDTVIPAAQIQSDWNQTNTNAKDYIKNKPSIPEAPVQSDWNQTTTTALDYIKNKPNIPSTANWSDKAASDHTHGNITNDGKITATAVSTGSGFVIYDSNNLIQRITTANAKTLLGVPSSVGVTSVGMTVPTGLSVSPASITSTGTFAITYATGYSIPTDEKQTYWDGKVDAVDLPQVMRFI